MDVESSRHSEIKIFYWKNFYNTTVRVILPLAISASPITSSSVVVFIQVYSSPSGNEQNPLRLRYGLYAQCIPLR